MMRFPVALVGGTGRLLVALLALGCTSVHAEDRIWLDATVNDRPVKLAFDTGAGASVLFRRTAERLKLRVTDQAPNARIEPGEIRAGRTEELRLKLAPTVPARRVTLAVIDMPSYLSSALDGVIAWADLKNNVVELDWARGSCRVSKTLPPNVKGWTRWKVVLVAGTLGMESRGGETARIVIDTGAEDGVQLNPQRWRQWRSAHVRQPSTMDAAYTPADGLVVSEVVRARTLALGGLTLNDLPVTVSPPGMHRRLSPYDAVLGLFALKQLRLTIDGRNGVSYTQPVAEPPPRYEYNRLGAVFVPRDPETSDDLEAHVATGSPAEKAGIRKGDLLLMVDAVDVTRWRSDPNVRASRFWKKPAGAKLRLTLKRAGVVVKTTVTLRDPTPEG